MSTVQSSSVNCVSMLQSDPIRTDASSLRNDHVVQGLVHQIQSKEASIRRQICIRPAEMPGLRHIHNMAWILLSVLWL